MNNTGEEENTPRWAIIGIEVQFSYLERVDVVQGACVRCVEWVS